MPIRQIDIGVREIGTREIRSWEGVPPIVDLFSRPLTTRIGLPIVNIPGCVEARENNNNRQLLTDDPKGNLTFCDALTPSFNPIMFEPERLLFTPKAKIDTRTGPKKPKAPEKIVPPKAEPKAATVPPVEEKETLECPSIRQREEQPIGSLVKGGTEKVLGYELIDDIYCKQITEQLSIPSQIITSIPEASTITTTATIAVVATTSALMAKPFADLLLKVVKPTTKKVVKKIAKIRGKTTAVLSTNERRNEQRDRNKAIMALRQTLKPK